MYYRAEYHPYKTKNMIEAQQIFKKWLINNGYQTSISNQLKIQPNKIKK